MTDVIRTNNLKRDGRCAKRRKFNFLTNEVSQDILKKAGAERKVALDAFYNKYSFKEIKEALETEYDERNIYFATNKTKARQVEIMTKCIYRFVSSVLKVPVKRNDIKEVTISFDELSKDVIVKPDIIFETADSIEIVKLKTKKPDVTQRGKKRDGSAMTSLELYALWCYGRKMLPAGSSKTITAAYYFLKKPNDRFTEDLSYHFDTEFYDVKNVITLSENVVKYADGNCNESNLDKVFSPQLTEYEEGDVECDKTNCEYCDMKELCSFKHAPVYEEEDAVVRSLSRIKLTPEQKDAIECEDAYIRCNAGAGAGKTLVVALRVVNLILSGVKPEHIMLCTFTNSGAGEMRERIKSYLEDYSVDVDTDAITIKTFNAFCNDIIIDEYDKLGFESEPKLIEEPERARLISKIADAHEVENLDYTNFDSPLVWNSGLNVMSRAFDVIKKYQLNIGDENILKEKLPYTLEPATYEQLLECYNEYYNVMRENNLIEFADQELLFFELLQQNPYYLEDFGYKYIIVDEFQDSNESQMKLIKALCSCTSFKSLMVVGDDSQSIFSFRDTSPEFIINFFDRMNVPESERKDIFLINNYRSTQNIIKLANKVNELNENRVKKDLIATREAGIIPEVRGFHEKTAEYEYIINKVKKLINSGEAPEDISCILADRYMIMEVGNLLTEAGIPWISLNPEPILENSRVVAAIALAKAIDNPKSTKDIMVYVNAQLNNELLDMAEDDIQANIAAMSSEINRISKLKDIDKSAVFIDMLESIDYEEDEIYESFIDSLNFRKSFAQKLEYILAVEKYGYKMTKKREKRYPGVTLTTIHSSKGLEWKHCILSLTKVYDLHCKGDKEYQEEKRRLVFVGITRARDTLTITGQYVAYGSESKGYQLNMYLKEIFEALDVSYDPVDHDKEARHAAKKTEAAANRIARLKAKKKFA